jgi:hypothetical protein
MNATAALLLAAASALVSAEIAREGDEARDELLQTLARALPRRDCSTAELLAQLVDAAVWDSTPEQLPNAPELQAAVAALVARDADPTNARPSRFSMFEGDDDEDPNEDARRWYEANLLPAESIGFRDRD